MSRTCRGARIRGGFLAKGRAESFDLTKLPEGDGEQVLANVVVEGEPPVAVMPAVASRHVIIGGSVSRGSTEKISQRLEGTETVLADRVTAEVRLRARTAARPGLRSS